MDGTYITLTSNAKQLMFYLKEGIESVELNLNIRKSICIARWITNLKEKWTKSIYADMDNKLEDYAVWEKPSPILRMRIETVGEV